MKRIKPKISRHFSNSIVTIRKYVFYDTLIVKNSKCETPLFPLFTNSIPYNY